MKLDQTFKDYIIENNNLTIEKQKEDKLKDLIPESKEAFTYESIPKVEIKEKSETEGKEETITTTTTVTTKKITRYEEPEMEIIQNDTFNITAIPQIKKKLHKILN